MVGTLAERIAPLGSRVRAFLWDYLLILAYLVVLAAVVTLLLLSPVGDRWLALFADPVRADALAALLTVLPVTLYFFLGESSAACATWGKRRVGLRVLSRGGARLSRRRALLRSVVKFLPWQISHTGIFHIADAGSTGAAASMPEAWPEALILLAWSLIALYMLAIRYNALGRTPYDWVADSVVVVARRD